MQVKRTNRTPKDLLKAIVDSQILGQGAALLLDDLSGKHVHFYCSKSLILDLRTWVYASCSLETACQPTTRPSTLTTVLSSRMLSQQHKNSLNCFRQWVGPFIIIKILSETMCKLCRRYVGTSPNRLLLISKGLKCIQTLSVMINLQMTAALQM